MRNNFPSGKPPSFTSFNKTIAVFPQFLQAVSGRAFAPWFTIMEIKTQVNSTICLMLVDDIDKGVGADMPGHTALVVLAFFETRF